MSLNRNWAFAILFAFTMAFNLNAQNELKIEELAELPKKFKKEKILKTFDLGSSYAFLAKKSFFKNKFYIIEKATGEELFESDLDLGDDGVIHKSLLLNGKLHVFVKKLEQVKGMKLQGLPIQGLAGSEIWLWTFNDKGKVVSKKPFIEKSKSPLSNPTLLLFDEQKNLMLFAEGYRMGENQFKVMLTDTIGNILQVGMIKAGNSDRDYYKMYVAFTSSCFFDLEGNIYASYLDEHLAMYSRVNNFEGVEFQLPKSELPVGCDFNDVQFLELNEDSILVTANIVKVEENDVENPNSFFQLQSPSKQTLKGNLSMIISPWESKLLSQKLTYLETKTDKSELPTLVDLSKDKAVVGQGLATKVYLTESGTILKVSQLRISAVKGNYSDYLVLAAYKVDGSRIWDTVINKWQTYNTHYKARETFEEYSLIIDGSDLVVLFHQGKVEKGEINAYNGQLSSPKDVLKTDLKMYRMDLENGNIIWSGTLGQESSLPYTLMPTYTSGQGTGFDQLFMFYNHEAKRNVLGRLSFN